MAAWVCRPCGTVYHVDAAACPACGADDHHEQGAEPMPKNTRASGASHAAAGVGPDPVTVDDDHVDADHVDEAASDPTGPVVTPEADADGDDDGEKGDAAETPTVPAGDAPARPPVGATREAWAGYAQTVHGIDPTGLTRQALIDAVTDAEGVQE